MKSAWFYWTFEGLPLFQNEYLSTLTTSTKIFKNLEFDTFFFLEKGPLFITSIMLEGEQRADLVVWMMLNSIGQNGIYGTKNL